MNFRWVYKKPIQRKHNGLVKCIMEWEWDCDLEKCDIDDDKYYDIKRSACLVIPTLEDIRDDLTYHLGTFGIFTIIDRHIVWKLYKETKSEIVDAHISWKYNSTKLEFVYKESTFRSIIIYNKSDFIVWLKEYWHTEIVV